MDEFLRNAQIEWRRQPIEPERLHTRLRRNRWTPHLLLGLEILGGLGGFAVGLYFFWTALTVGGLLYALSAVVMLCAMPVSIMFSILARRGALRWEDETPEGVLCVSLARAEASLRAIRLSYLSGVVVAGFVVVLWIAQASGLIHAFDFILFYSITSAAVCVPYLVYLAWRSRRVRADRAACRRLMAELTSPEVLNG